MSTNETTDASADIQDCVNHLHDGLHRRIASVEGENVRFKHQNDVRNERGRKCIVEIDQLRKDLDAAQNVARPILCAKRPLTAVYGEPR